MTLFVSEEVAKGLKLIKGGFYTLNSLEKAIDNKGGELHLDTKVVFEELTKDEIIKALFYGFKVKSKKITDDDLDTYFTIRRKNGEVYHIIVVDTRAFVADTKYNTSTEYSIDSVLRYINDGIWIIQ